MQNNSTGNDTSCDSRAAISMAIARLRLPLIIGVVLIHCNVPEVLQAWHSDGADTSLRTARAISNVSLLLDRTVTSVFFFISGFLFFLNTNGFSFSRYKEKLRRRVTTLLVPYLLWNTIFFVLHTGKTLFAAATSGSATDLTALFLRFPTAFWSYADFCPADLPLWFVRDLMVTVLFAPLIHSLTKKWRVCIFIPLLFCWLWLLPQWRTVGVNPQAFFYFSLGAAYSVNRLSPMPKSNTITILAAFVIAVIAAFCKPLFASAFDEVVRLIGVSAMIACGFGMFAQNKVIQNNNRKPLLSDKVFFIYAAHAIFAGTTVRLLSTVIAVNSNIGMMTIYVLAPLITLAATMVLHSFLTLLSPTLTDVLNGKRRTPQKFKVKN